MRPAPAQRAAHAARLLTAAKLPRVRFHDLRHSAASLLIAEGVQLAEVSMLLGHSELRVTADLYAHLTEADVGEGRPSHGCGLKSLRGSVRGSNADRRSRACRNDFLRILEPATRT